MYLLGTAFSNEAEQYNLFCIKMLLINSYKITSHYQITDPQLVLLCFSPYLWGETTKENLQDEDLIKPPQMGLGLWVPLHLAVKDPCSEAPRSCHLLHSDWPQFSLASHHEGHREKTLPPKKASWVHPRTIQKQECWIKASKSHCGCVCFVRTSSHCQWGISISSKAFDVTQIVLSVSFQFILFSVLGRHLFLRLSPTIPLFVLPMRRQWGILSTLE